MCVGQAGDPAAGARIPRGRALRRIWSASVDGLPIELRFEVDELGELVRAITIVPENFTFSAGLVAVNGASMRLEAPRLGVMTATVIGDAMTGELRASGGAVSF